MRRSGVAGLRRLGLGLLVAGVTLISTEAAPTAGEPDGTRQERLHIPVDETCVLPPNVSSLLPSTCVLPSRKTRAKETTAPTPPTAATCDEPPVPWRVLDAPRMTEC